MNKRFLNKKIDSSLLKQSLPENILHRSRSKVRKTKFVTDYNSTGFDRQPDGVRSSRLEKIKQAETQIVWEFVQKGLAKIRNNREFATDTVLSIAPNTDMQLPCAARTIIEESKFMGHVLRTQQHYFKSKNSASFKTGVQQKELQLHSTPREAAAEEDVFLLLSIEQIRNILVSKRIEKQAPSELRDQLLESRKIRFLYGGLSKRELKRSIKRARQLLGNTADNLLTVLESRLDVALERCAFFSSIRFARQSIIHARVQVNEKIVKTPGYWLQPGDVIQVKLLKKPSAKVESLKVKSDLLADPIAVQTLREQFGNESSLNSSCRIPVKSIEASTFAHKRMHLRQTLNSLSEVECLLSNICLQTTQISCTCLLCLRSKQRKQAFYTHLTIDRAAHGLIRKGVGAAPLHYPYGVSARGLAKQTAVNSSCTGSGLRCLQEKTFLRLNSLIKASELYLAIQNKAYFSKLFVKKFIPNPSFKRNNTLNIDAKTLGSIFKATTPDLALHIQQILQKTVNTTMQKPNVLVNVNQQDCMSYTVAEDIIAISDPKLYYPLFLKEKQQNSAGKNGKSCEELTRLREVSKHNEGALFCFDDTFYHVYFYWLQLAKILLSRDAREQFLRQNMLSAKNRIASFQYRKTKVLHLEVSYQSCNAIFLYPPQRVYLAALVNVDLLVKVL